VFLFGLLHLILRYWLLPDIENYRNSIASAITQEAGQQVSIGSISANWDGLYPHLILRKVHVHDKEGKPALILNRLESIPAWDSLLSGELRFRKIKIDQPDLTIYRDSKGVLHVAGITLVREPDTNHSSFLNWLLNQKEVEVVNANISWKDEKLGAPLIELESVSLYLENYNVNRYRFSLYGIPPAKVASPINIHGDFVSKELNIPEQWDGNLFVKLDYVNIAAWLDDISHWPKVKNISANLLFQEGSIEIIADRVSISDLDLSQIKIQIDDMFESDTNLAIKGTALGLTRKFIKFSAENIIDTFTPNDIDRFNITGNGKLLIDLSIPLPYSDVIKISGSYIFNNNRVDLGPNIPSLEKINGTLNFTESTIEVEKIRAKILGGIVTINSTPSENTGVNLIASGRIDLDNLDFLNQEEKDFWAKYASGSADWNGSIKIGNNVEGIRSRILIESSLEGISLDFPEPFSKIATDSILFRIVNSISDSNQNNFKINYGDEVAAEFNLSLDESDGYYVDKGLIRLGAERVKLPESGILLAGKLPRLQVDEWNDISDQFNTFKEIDKENRIDLGLTKIDLYIGKLDFLGSRINDLVIDSEFENEKWSSNILSQEISGKFIWNLKNKGKLIGRFKRFAMPSSYHVEPPVARNKKPTKKFPSIDILVEKFFISGSDVGKLGVIAGQTKQGWVVDELYVTSPDSSFTADGIWRNYSVAPRMDMNIKLGVNNVNKFLTRLGYSDRIKRGKGELFGTLSWLGGPQEINYKTLSGKINLKIKDGQFPKFELGIGKLFGIFDLGALPRRVFLDFRDVYADGFGFDKVSGSADIIEGIMSTQKIKIKGPAADVHIDGEINLFSETYALHFVVTPSLGLATPMVDIATIIVNKAKKGSINPNEYNITGPWKDPVITRLH
tara:strand:+ start:119 stop:2830 length:2712 start_codon:yes stop_codon:yes gene_type:complete